jgi:hypothetical protein
MKTKPMGLQKLNFERNYNNKLRCRVFTSLRLPHEKLKVGARFEITLGGYYKGTAKIIGVDHIRGGELPFLKAKLDTGFDVKETMQILKDCYKNRPCINWATQELTLLYLEWEGQERMSDIFITKEDES